MDGWRRWLGRRLAVFCGTGGVLALAATHASAEAFTVSAQSHAIFERGTSVAASPHYRADDFMVIYRALCERVAEWRAELAERAVTYGTTLIFIHAMQSSPAPIPAPTAQAESPTPTKTPPGTTSNTPTGTPGPKSSPPESPPPPPPPPVLAAPPPTTPPPAPPPDKLPPGPTGVGQPPVDIPPPPTDAPEPTGLFSGVLGLALATLAYRRRRRDCTKRPAQSDSAV